MACWRLAERAGALLLLLLGGGCTGFMQAPLPATAASYARVHAVAELRAGAAEADITPAGMPWLGGFGLARRATAVHARLKARALVLRAGARAVAIVGVDSLGLQRQDVDWIKGGIAGFALGDVFLCSSHTHAGPDPVGLWGWYFLTSGRDGEYMALLRRQIAAAVAAADAACRPARLLHGTARLPAAGLVRNANRAGVFERDLHVLQAVAEPDGTPIAGLLHLACHPEVISRHHTLLSPDFVGALCDGWKERGHGQAVFVNGALGAMVSPDVRDRTERGADAMGQALCDLAEQALRAAAPVAVDAIEVRRADLYLDMRALGLVFARQSLVVPRPTHAGMLRSTVGYLRVGPLEIACVPGEMEPGLAARLRQTTGRPRLLVFGLVDDEVGYLLSRRDAEDREFDYERSMSPGPDAGEAVVRALGGSDRVSPQPRPAR